jgi:hypothetical protein
LTPGSGRPVAILGPAPCRAQDVDCARLHHRVKWDSDFELVTKKEVVVAFEAVCWNARKKVFESLRR